MTTTNAHKPSSIAEAMLMEREALVNLVDLLKSSKNYWDMPSMVRYQVSLLEMLSKAESEIKS